MSVLMSSGRGSGRSEWRRLLVGVGAGFVGVSLPVLLSVAIGGGEPASAYTRTWTAHHLSAPNPTLEPGCGLDVGLLIDRSGSIANAGAEEKMRTAARTFVDALAGTPSRVGVWSFGRSSAAAPGDPDHPAAPLTDLGGSNARPGATALKTTIDSIPFTGGATTNWDAAFRAVHEASATQHDSPDLLVVLTDGQPTVSGDSPSTVDAMTDDADIDAGIASANVVKSDGTRIFAVGIGAEVDTAALSLISGGTAWNGSNFATADYGLTSFDGLATTLRAAVSDLCGGTVTVQKVVRDGSGGERPEAGWHFELSGRDDPTWATGQTTDKAGMVQFSVPGVGTERVSIHEVAQPGVDLLADEILCDNTSGLQPVLQRDARGISFDLGPKDVIACTFPNLRAPVAPPTTLPPTTVPPTTVPPTTVPPTTVPSTTVPPTTVPPTTVPSAGPMTVPPATVLAAVQEPSRVTSLPRTGAEPGRLVLAAVCLLAGGFLVTVGVRRGPEPR